MLCDQKKSLQCLHTDTLINRAETTIKLNRDTINHPVLITNRAQRIATSLMWSTKSCHHHQYHQYHQSNNNLCIKIVRKDEFMCWTEVAQQPSDVNDRCLDLRDNLPVVSHPGCSERRLYTMTLPISNGACNRRSTTNTLPIYSMMQTSPADGSTTIDTMSLSNSKRVHFARPVS